MKKASNILWGLLFVAAGVILALNAFGFTNIDIFFDGWWTLFIIVPCAVNLFTSYDKTGSLIGIFVGVFLLLCCQDVLSFGLLWKLFLPAIIVLIGVKLILKGVWGGQHAQVFQQIQQNGGTAQSSAATFASNTLDYTGQIFTGAQLDAVFGGLKCDLRGAVIQSDCAIQASAIFGGIDIYVPAGVNVKVTSNSLFGGVSGKERRNDPAAQHTLYVNANCLFGGVEIK